jgi:hypothetical protein
VLIQIRTRTTRQFAASESIGRSYTRSTETPQKPRTSPENLGSNHLNCAIERGPAKAPRTGS